jgi:DNA-directed RNA polymerase III subunit RPC7
VGEERESALTNAHPRYTVIGRKRGMEDPFNDIARYSQKYRKLERRAPKLDARPYIADFFPEELYATMGITSGEGEKKKKTLLISALDEFDLEEAEEDQEGKAEEKGEEKEEDEIEEEDDHFSEDEDDDYNAEKYFESGDDMEDYGDDDGGDGGDFF